MNEVALRSPAERSELIQETAERIELMPAESNRRILAHDYE